jgi:hypothetical protein
VANQIQPDLMATQPMKIMKTLLKLVKSRVILAAATCLTFFLAGTNLASALSGTFDFDFLPGYSGAGQPSGGYMAIDSTGDILENSLFQDYIKKYDTNGNLLWKTAVTTNNTSTGNYGRVIVDSANNVYTDGISDIMSNSVDYLTLSLEKISPAGKVLWSINYIIDPDNEDASAGPMVIGNNGSIYVAIRGAPLGQPTSPFWIVRVNTSNGAFQKMVSPGNTVDASYTMAESVMTLDGNNNVYFGGTQGILSYSSDLSTLRWKNFSTNTSSSSYYVRAIICDSANNVYETGLSPSGPNSSAYTMITKRLNNSNGSVTWTSSNFLPVNLGLGFYPQDVGRDRRYGGNALALDSAGQLYAVGCAQDTHGFIGSVLVKYNPSTGAAQWSTEIPFSDYLGIGASVAIDNSNNIHVGGLNGDGDGAGLGTIYVYNTSSALLWNTSINFTTGDNVFTQILLDNKGSVWVMDNILDATVSPIIAKYTEH